jgi:glycosyltransferase involved in cell wall biosynthesis
LVCLPYRSASQSGVTAIAIQYGKPVVASAVGGLVEYFKDNSLGTLCEPNDPEALASAVLKQLRAPALDAIELESVQRRFSWKAFAQVALSQEEATKA